MAIAVRRAQTTWEGPLASGTDAVIGEASNLCLVSRLFAGAKITVDATLAPGS